MSQIDELIDWKSRWRLSQGQVFCKGCDGRQAESDKGVAFVHSLYCRHAEHVVPWLELDEILRTSNPE